jgi:hypothetical protein
MNAQDTPPLQGHSRGPVILAAVALVLVAAFALPVAAWVVESISATAANWILPLQVVIVLAFAAGLAAVTAGPEQRRRRVALGLAAGVIALVVVDLMWWLLLAG